MSKEGEVVELTSVKYPSAQQARDLLEKYKEDPLLFADERELRLLKLVFDKIKAETTRGASKTQFDLSRNWSKTDGYEIDTLLHVLKIKGYKAYQSFFGGTIYIQWGL